MIPAVTGGRCSLNATKIAVSASSVLLCIAVQNLFPEAAGWSADPVIIPWNRCEVADHKYGILCGFSFSDETDDTIFAAARIDPFKSLRLKIKFMHSGLSSIKTIQIPDPSPNALMWLILEKMPVQTRIMTPLPPLSELTPHKEVLLARMGVHITDEKAEICKPLPVIPWHPADQGSFSMDDLVVREWEQEVL